ncbi:MAG: glycosyltransferase [Selenomonadaceae bacterium]|nr:glycosyltransferase [Selenomonadaceae bacterium]
MKVSVIVPVFNAEKFLGVCLESLMIQTLKDFEVLVVDDCSTDSSVEVAEKFLERFGGRLKILRTEKNSGNASLPRNVGLKFSRGEYIFFMDNDDLLMPAALETFYDAAEKFSADVVYAEQGFICDEENVPQNLTPVSWTPPEFVRDELVMESADIGERLKNFLSKGYGVTPWIKFLRRDFLLANEIIFPRVKISEDVLWTIQVICLAKNLLRVPNRLYIYRSVKNSWSRVNRSPEDEIKFWLDPLVNGLDFLDEFMDGIIFFTQNPHCRFEVTNFFVKMQIARMLGAFKKLEPEELYEIVHDQFNGRHAALIANLFVFLNFYREKSLEVR